MPDGCVTISVHTTQPSDSLGAARSVFTISFTSEREEAVDAILADTAPLLKQHGCAFVDKPF